MNETIHDFHRSVFVRPPGVLFYYNVSDLELALYINTSQHRIGTITNVTDYLENRSPCK